MTRTETDLTSEPECEWRTVVASDAKFEVSNRGEVRKVATGKLVTLTTDHCGRLCCGVLHEGSRKIRKVHIMVAEAFIGPRPDGYKVSFKDGSKANCNSSNLRYASPKEHALDRRRDGTAAPSAKLTADQVLEMRQLIDARVRFAVIAAQYDISYGAVKKISRRLTWDHI